MGNNGGSKSYEGIVLENDNWVSFTPRSPWPGFWGYEMMIPWKDFSQREKIKRESQN